LFPSEDTAPGRLGTVGAEEEEEEALFPATGEGGEETDVEPEDEGGWARSQGLGGDGFI